MRPTLDRIKLTFSAICDVSLVSFYDVSYDWVLFPLCLSEQGTELQQLSKIDKIQK